MYRIIFLLLPLLAFGPLIAKDLKYDVVFNGVEKKSVRLGLKQHSTLLRDKKIPPPTLRALRERAENDIPNLTTYLRSLAYYNARIQVILSPQADAVKVVYTVDPGPLYPLASFEVVEEGKLLDFTAPLGKPALHSRILEEEAQLETALQSEGYPFAEVKKREVVVDQKSQTVHLTFRIERGQRARFGKTTIYGLDAVNPSVMQSKIAWKEGELYRPDRIEDTVSRFRKSGLFQSIRIEMEPELLDGDTLPITIHVVEGPPRVVAAGVSYSTHFGPGIVGEWSHENMRGLGEKIYFSADLSAPRQKAAVGYRMPDLFRPQQDLVFLGEVETEQLESYDVASISLSGIIDRTLSKKLQVSYGGEMQFLSTDAKTAIASQVEDDNYTLLKAPATLRFSTANSVLNPTRGVSVALKFTPTTQLLSPVFFYVNNQATGIFYIPLGGELPHVIAFKIKAGSILGAKNKTIPIPERLFAGSQDTLRGYEYETVSPLVAGQPIGGRSLMALSVEARIMAAEKWGGVVFYEIGNVYKDAIPKFNHKQLQSTGLGLRYYTPIGPVRLDLGFPLNRRKGLDSSYQLYFSIGQAF